MMENESKYRVLHLLGSVGHGGAEILFYDLVRLTNKDKNHNPFRFAFYKDGQLAEELLQYSSATKIISTNKLNLIIELRKYFIANKINIVHCHSPFHVFYIIIATIGLSVKKVLTVHGFKNSRKSRIIFSLSFKLCDSILFVSNSFMDRIESYISLPDANKLNVHYNGIDQQKISKWHRPLSKKKYIVLGMVGNFHNDGRDHYTLCRAALILKEKGIPFQLQFVGGASAENSYFLDQCKEFVNEHGLKKEVQFLGFRDDVDELLQRWDLFVYSSNRDSFGIAVVEAIMSGIPVLVNDLDVFTEITENGKLATLFKTKDAEDAAKKITGYYQNPEPYFDKAEKGAKLVREKYSIERHYQNLIQLYSSL